MYTTAAVFLRSLASAGITHVFVNWGSDHPAILEELERQRVESGDTSPEIVTSPNEMVALSAAQGYAQATGKPAAVIVHVDVGTQAMAGAIHNVDRGHVPVLIYAGASPYSCEGIKGARNEWIMWLQDVPDQSAIVRQYMRFTSQLHSASTTADVVRRAVQIGTSDPKGPVYLWARREVMEEEVDQRLLDSANATLYKWPSVEPAALSPSNAKRIASALFTAHSPLIITSHLGRNSEAVAPLLALSTLLAIPVFCTCPSAVNIPFSHPYFAGLSYLQPGRHSGHLATADVILVIECDLPWIPANGKPSEDARVFVLDSGDPLKTTVGFWHTDAELICRADAEVALGQIIDDVRRLGEQSSVVGENLLNGAAVKERGQKLAAEHKEWMYSLDVVENDFPALPVKVSDAIPNDNDLLSSSAGTPGPSTITVANIMGVLRQAVQALTPAQGAKTLYINEGVSNYPFVWAHLKPDIPGSMITSGGSSLGWGLAAAVGAHIGGKVSGPGYELVVAIVGDGSFLFGVPSSVFWMARKYQTPFLTIVLNNGGWKSPRLSMLGVYPSGLGSKAAGEQLSVGFGPACPDYAQVAVAASAGWAWGERVGVGENAGKEALENVIAQAISLVVEEGRCAVVDCVLDSI